MATKILVALFSALLAAVATGLGAWLSWGQSAITRAEAISIVETQSPYIRDQKSLVDALEQIHMLGDGQQVIREELAKLHTMMELHTRDHR